METVDCNLCNTNNTEVVYESTVQIQEDNPFFYACTNDGHGEHFRVVKCKNCGLYYCSPRLNGSDLEKMYFNVTDKIYKEEMGGRIKTFQRTLNHLDKYKKKGKLLDIGCSIGIFLYLAKKKGWEVNGIEPSAWCVEQGKNLFHFDNEISNGFYKDLNNIGSKYDVVTMWDVLEHIDDPTRALMNCNNVMKKGGILALSTVNIGSLYAKIMGKRWPWLMKMHIYYFDKKTIKKYLEKAGLELLEIKTYKHTVSIDYLLYKLKNIHPFSYFILKAFKKIILLGKNIYINIAMGDFIEVYARKK